jgi:hypothetical protein
MHGKTVQTLLIGLWICFVSLASTYAGAYLKTHPFAVFSKGSHGLEIRRVKPITVPIISGGTLKGYVSAEFSFLKDDLHKREGALDPESYFMDEAFRLIYSDNTIDFNNIEKFDLAGLTKKITERVNERLGRAVVKETLVKSFAFVPREDVPH